MGWRGPPMGAGGGGRRGPRRGAGGSASRVTEKRHGLPESCYAATPAKHAPPKLLAIVRGGERIRRGIGASNAGIEYELGRECTDPARRNGKTIAGTGATGSTRPGR